MKKNVLLTVQATQHYPGQEPETMEFLTDGTLEQRDGGWDICYEESELTGLVGVTTKLRLEPGQITLERSGRLRSTMTFQQGVVHESLYEMEFGAMMMCVCAQMIEARIGEQGGTVDLQYSISVENSAAGLVEYHLRVKPTE